MPRRPAFTLMEVALSIVVVALMFVAALNAAGSARTLSTHAADRAAARALAQDLMAEVCSCPIDEGLVSGLVGVVLGVVSSDRSTFDVIDDYDRWSESPPKDRDGTAIPGFSSDWSRAVAVTSINAATYQRMPPRSGKTAARRITVTVSRRGEALCTLTTIRSEAGDILWHDQ